MCKMKIEISNFLTTCEQLYTCAYCLTKHHLQYSVLKRYLISHCIVKWRGIIIMKKIIISICMYDFCMVLSQLSQFRYEVLL